MKVLAAFISPNRALCHAAGVFGGLPYDENHPAAEAREEKQHPRSEHGDSPHDLVMIWAAI
jgi:hypothetical protein